jgi:cell division protein FtsL
MNHHVNGLCSASRKLLVGTFVVQLVILAVVVLHLFAAWQYKTKWQDLNKRLGQVEKFLSQQSLETTTPKSPQ